MRVSRRDFIGTLTATATMAEALRVRAQEAPTRVGMCDWSLGRTADPSAFDLAVEIGLDGVEASLTFSEEPTSIRTKEGRAAYLAHAKELRIAIPSIALGILNQVPLRSEPLAAELVGESVVVAQELGAKSILLAFFGLGEFEMTDTEAVDNIVGALKDAAPDAEEAGVSLGIESYLSAEDHLDLIERVGSDAIGVYYDCKNATHAGHNAPAEIRQLEGRICQVHLKNGANLLKDFEDVDFGAVAEALIETGYDGWLVLETGSPSGDLVADTRANMEYAKALMMVD